MMMMMMMMIWISVGLRNVLARL